MSRTGHSRKADPRGFSFFELLLVLLILGLFSTLLTLRLEGLFTGGDLRRASREIIGEIARLRGRAAHSRVEQVLRFNLDENCFYPVEKEIGEDDSTGWTAFPVGFEGSAKREMPEGVELVDVVLLSGGKVQEGEVDIRFFANGCVESAFIHLRNRAQAVHTLEINPITGQVRIHDCYVDRIRA
ncbi:MAG: prepilin-type N-terminal cleavage/methylation domain-containing protein [Deltaproteobacteria bacterium]|nr:prepilin-type N-terminal cleavage/methylation domain-containing protein [Deltaproteobacteria bacterium]